MRQGEAKRKPGSVKIAGWCQHDGPRAVNADSPVEVLGPHLDLQIKFLGFSGVKKLQNGGGDWGVEKSYKSFRSPLERSPHLQLAPLWIS